MSPRGCIFAAANSNGFWKTKPDYHNKLALEILGERRLVIIYYQLEQSQWIFSGLCFLSTDLGEKEANNSVKNILSLMDYVFCINIQ